MGQVAKVLNYQKNERNKMFEILSENGNYSNRGGFKIWSSRFFIPPISVFKVDFSK